MEEILVIENPNFKCPQCASKNIKGRCVEDDYGHEDWHYICQDCGKSWWIDGIDY